MTQYISAADQMPPLGEKVVALFDSGCDYPEYVEAIAWLHPKRGSRVVWFIADRVIQKRGCPVLFWALLPPHPKG